jgi:hypothetical protein
MFISTVRNEGRIFQNEISASCVHVLWTSKRIKEIRCAGQKTNTVWECCFNDNYWDNQYKKVSFPLQYLLYTHDHVVFAQCLFCAEYYCFLTQSIDQLTYNVIWSMWIFHLMYWTAIRVTELRIQNALLNIWLYMGFSCLINRCTYLAFCLPTYLTCISYEWIAVCYPYHFIFDADFCLCAFSYFIIK